MRLAQIILPAQTNAGMPIPTIHASLARDLSHAFGGCTALPGNGAWTDPVGNLIQEPVVAYQIACKDSAVTVDQLRQFALHYGQLAGQQAMMLVLPSGEVEFLDCPPAESALAA